MEKSCESDSVRVERHCTQGDSNQSELKQSDESDSVRVERHCTQGDSNQSELKQSDESDSVRVEKHCTQGDSNQSELKQSDESDSVRVEKHCTQGDSNQSELKQDDKRMFFLKKSIDKTVHRCINVGSLSLFGKCFPSLARTNVKALRSLHKQYRERLTDAIQAEIGSMIEEENLPQLMNEMDKIVADEMTDKQRSAWRPSGDPESDVRAHLITINLKTKERLKRILSNVEQHNTELIKTIVPLRETLQKTEILVQESCDSLNQAAKEIDVEEIDSVLKEEML